MATTNDLLYDALTRHQIFIQRYAFGREKQAIETIERIKETIQGRLSSNLDTLSKARLDRLLLDLKGLSKGLYDQMADDIMTELIEFTDYEIGFMQRMLEANTTADIALPAPEQIQAAIYTNVMKLEPTKNYSVTSILSDFSLKKANQITQTITDGVILGDTTPNIVASLANIFRLQVSQASTLARTITNHVATQARLSVIDQNRDIVEGYRWSATLDSRTSLICASRDGQIYPDTDNPTLSPKPPAHFSCRSTIVPVVKEQFSLFKRARTTRAADTRIVRNGKVIDTRQGRQRVSAARNYESWLRRQSQDFQEEVLGTTKARLFRDGNLELSRFVDQTGREYTLDDLRKLEPMTFERLGI